MTSPDCLRRSVVESASLIAGALLACASASGAPALPTSGAARLTSELAERAPVVAAAALSLFGGFHAFTADADLRVLDRAGAEIFNGPVTYARDGFKARLDADASQATSARVPAGVLAQLQALGVGTVAAIARPDQLRGYALYPALSAYAEAAIPPNVLAAALAGTNATLVKTPVGNETIDGHPSVKNQTTVTAPNGQRIEALVWNATDLQGFPIQIEYADRYGSATVRFKRVNLTAPAASLFDVPAGYTKYTAATLPADVKTAAKDALKRVLGR